MSSNDETNDGRWMEILDWKLKKEGIFNEKKLKFMYSIKKNL